MSSCPSTVQLERLLVDELDRTELADVSAHVESCAGCQSSLEALTRSDAGFRHVRSAGRTTTAVGYDDFVRRLQGIPVTESIRNVVRPGPRDDDNTVVTSESSPPRTAVNFAVSPAIPGFEVLSELGRGGMAVVYKARQLNLKRLVALKMIHAAGPIGSDRLARFRSEAEAVARLHHPGIVQIYETGEYRGLPYLALELVAGGSLAQKTRAGAQPARRAAALIAAVADAVDAAHRAGIIHRDLTPSNILLADALAGADDADPSDELAGYGRPKITDFGLAIDVADGARQTRTGEVVGTPHYMAPEQAQGRRKEFGPATDIHALGAILYELLTGRPPFLGATAVDTLVQVSYEEPLPPTRLRADLPRDLETICLKCLQKDPRHRYASAQALAADLRRFLNGESILARPTSIGGRVIKWARRRPLIAAMTAASLLLGVAALASLSWALAEESDRRAQAEANEKIQADLRDQAQIERLRSERMSAAAILDQAVSQGDHGHIDRALLLLVRGLELAVQSGDADLERVARINLTAWRRQLVRVRATMTHPNWVWAVVYHPDGQSFVTASRDRTARVYATASGQPVGNPMQHTFPVWAVAYSPDGNTLVTASGEEWSGELRFWDARTGRALGPPQKGQNAHSVGFSTDGRVFLSVGGGRALVWKWGGRLPMSPAVSLDHPDGVVAAVLSPNGDEVLTGGMDGTARRWDAASGAQIGDTLPHELSGGPEENVLCVVSALAYSPDGRTIATGCQTIDSVREWFIGGEVRLWSGSGEALGVPLPHRGPIKSVAFSPDGRRLLAGAIVLGTNTVDFTGEAKLWDVETGRQLGPTLERQKPVWAVAFSPDGRTLMTGCEAGSAEFWSTAVGLPTGFGGGEGGNVTSVAFAPDGRTAVSGKTYEPATAKLWEVPPGRGVLLPPRHYGPVRQIEYVGDGRLLLSAGIDGKLLRWDTATGRPVGSPLEHRRAIQSFAVNRDGTIAATTSNDKKVRFWDVVAGEPLGRPLDLDANSPLVVLSPDGSQVLTLAGSDTCRLWDRATARPVGDLLRHGGSLTHLAFSPNGGVIASGGADGMVRLWRSSDGGPACPPLKQGGAINALNFSPDGKVIATTSRDQMVRLWRVGSGEPLGEPMPHRGSAVLVFSPDGRTLLSGSDMHTVWLFDVAASKPIGPPLQHRAAVVGAAISADGRTAAVTCSDRSVWLWDVTTGHQLGPPIRHVCAVTSTAFHPRGDVLATAGDDGLIRLFDVPEPATADVANLRQWVEALTGMRLGEQGILYELGAAAVSERQKSLSSAGPEPFPRPARAPTLAK